jgi:hypothetical protein
MFRSFLFLGIICIAVSIAFFYWGSAAGEAERVFSYAKVSVDRSIEDETLLTLLGQGYGKYWNSIISESSQLVYLDEFGSVSAVPLNVYFNRINDFDPRNDGYANKLRDIFFEDDQRNVFLHIGNTKMPSIIKNVNKYLKDVTHTLVFYGFGKPVRFFFLLYVVAAFFFPILCFFMKIKFRSLIGVFILLPVLFPLSFFGAAGLASAAVIAGLFALLAEAINELCILHGKRRGFLLKKSTALFMPYLIEISLMVFTLLVIAILSNLPLIFITVIFLVSAFLSFFSIWVLQGGKNHKRFTPIKIINKHNFDFAFSIYMLPFAVSSIMALLLSLWFAGSAKTESPIKRIIHEHEYREHIDFQTAFSTSPLWDTQADYSDYFFDKDGLVAEKPVNNMENIRNYPPFPLAPLMNYMENLNNTGVIKVNNNFNLNELLSLLLISLIIAAGFLLKGKKRFLQRNHFSPFKVISGFRMSRIKRANTVLYKHKNDEYIRDEYIRKDA